MLFNRIAVIGLGLIGGSLARAIHTKMPGVELAVMDKDKATLAAVRKEGIAALVTGDAAEAVKGAELVVLCVPIPALAAATKAMAAGLAQGAIVTDVASCKRVIFQDVLPHLPESVTLVPGHPIAGTEKSGYAFSFATLFQDKPCILTPEVPESSGVAEVAGFWRALGAQVDFMPPDLHDHIYACVSHMPQYLAFILKDLYDELNVPRGAYSETFSRFTRLGDSPTKLWDGIFAANRDYMMEMAERYVAVIRQLQFELEDGARQNAGGEVDMELVQKALFPCIAAGCLVSTAYRLERDLGLPIARFACTGFIDFTIPAADGQPEEYLAAISDAAGPLAAMLDDFALRIERSGYISKQ